MTAPALLFLTRQGCTLCDQALPKVQRLARVLGFALTITDVDDSGLATRYGDRVPVVLGPDGSELAAGRMGPVRLAIRAAWARVRRA